MKRKSSTTKIRDGYYLGIRDSMLPEPYEIVDCPMEVGDVLLIQHMTVHRSTPNTTEKVRWSLDLRYCDPAMPTGRRSVPGFLVRSQSDPDAVAESYQDWTKLFADH